MTTAASVAAGRNAVTPGASRMKAISSAAPTTPVSCVREPACSATGVRDDEADTGNPPRKPPAMFARPMPAISWLPSTLSPRRAESDRESTALSVKATRAMPAAGSRSAQTSAHSRPPSAGEGRPCGSAPTTGSEPDSPKIAVIAVASTTTTSTPGTGELKQAQYDDHGERAHSERDGERLHVAPGDAPRRWPTTS